MQKKIIAVAVAALASTAAFAQSNVTVYGVADATFDSVKATGATAGTAFDFKNRARVGSNSSYIGFKGVEDLGNGLKAAFQIENGLQTENGAAGVWNNRDSYVGLAGGFGTVVAGNVTGPTRALGAKLDVNSGATGIGANTALLGKLGGGSGAGAFDQRINNAIAYISPSFSGFNAVVGYSTGLTNTYNGTALAGRENAPAGTIAGGNNAYTLGANYEAGPIYVGAAFTEVKASNNGANAAGVASATAGISATVSKLSNTRVGAIYKIGTAGQVGLLLDHTKAVTTFGANSEKQNVVYLSGKFNVTANGAIIGQVGSAGKIKLDGQSLDQTGAKHFELGYEQALSKRTVLKAVYSQINNQDAANYDYLYGVSNGNSTATGSTTAMTNGTSVKGLSVGVRHSF